MVPLLLAALGLAAALVLLALRVPPVPTWFYVFAWYPTLVLLDGLASRLDGRPSLFARRGLAASLFGWSPLLWLVFEAFNFRLENWYYVGLPAAWWERWLGITLSFATVLPAIVLAERLLHAAGLFRGRRCRPLTVRPRDLMGSVAIGLAALAAVLLWPDMFFPLVWGVGFALAEPLVYARMPALSLVRDLERGEWGRIGRLLVGGGLIGLLWESYNFLADGSWIYTVPGLEDLKLFEMPPFGYVGFPVFALEAWAMYAALCTLGVAVPVTGNAAPPRPRRVVPAALATLAFGILTLAGMERYTISSTVASADELDALDAATADLARLRRMGTDHARILVALGVADTCALADQDPAALARAARERTGGHRPTVAEARVWIRAAAERCEGGVREPA
jgi:hypothetical protein